MGFKPTRNSSNFLGWCITYILNISSNILFTLFVWQFVWGCKEVLKDTWVPKPSNKFFQNFEVILESLFDIILLGSTCNWYLCYEDMGYIYFFIGRLDNYKVIHLAQLIYYHHDNIMLHSFPRKLCNEDLRYKLPFPFLN